MSLDEIFIGRSYGAVCNLKPSPKDTILDLGANVGLSTRFWRTVFPAAIIIAVEPDCENMKIYRMNMRGEEPLSTAVSACAGGERRTAYLDRSGEEWAIRMHDIKREKDASVEVLTIPDILQLAGHQGEIQLLKCDIEGAEKEVFANCREWIHKVRNLLIEVHGEYGPESFLRDLEANDARFEAEELASGEGYSILFLQRKYVDES